MKNIKIDVEEFRKLIGTGVAALLDAYALNTLACGLNTAEHRELRGSSTLPVLHVAIEEKLQTARNIFGDISQKIAPMRLPCKKK